MSSNAYQGHLLQLLQDADRLEDTYGQVPVGFANRQACQASLNRAVVVMCVSAWEAYVEELARECLEVLRPTGAMGVWSALNASVRAYLGRFNNPSLENVKLLISDVVGLQDVDQFWGWQNCS